MDHSVSMPSMSGGALRPAAAGQRRTRRWFLCPRCRAGLCDPPAAGAGRTRRGFLCPRCRAGLCDPTAVRAGRTRRWVSMPSMSGGALRRRNLRPRDCVSDRVSMPSMSGGALRRRLPLDSLVDRPLRFYALDVGRGFATAVDALARPCRSVSMPSMSGGALRLQRRTRSPTGTLPFLCPRCRAGLCDFNDGQGHPRVPAVSMPSMSGGALRHGDRLSATIIRTVSMPSMSGGALRPRRRQQAARSGTGFYALDVGRGFATRQPVRLSIERAAVSMPSMSGGALRRVDPLRVRRHAKVSMPSMSGGALRHRPHLVSPCARNPRFYALDVGRGFATRACICRRSLLGFLCPRCRAGLCDADRVGSARDATAVSMPSMSGGALRPLVATGASWSQDRRFYALDVGRGFATTPARRLASSVLAVSMPSMSGGALRPQDASSKRHRDDRAVSMPSMSGGALRPGTTVVAELHGRTFLCPRCRAGLCDDFASGSDLVPASFLCPRCRAGLCDWSVTCAAALTAVSMPSMSGGALRRLL